MLGVNIQWTDNGKMIERQIAMEKITSRHSAENIGKMVIDLLQNKYQISLNYLVAATVDNAKNMIASVKKIDKFISSLRNENNVDDDDESTDESDFERGNSEDETTTMESLWFDPDYQRHLLQAAANELCSKYKPILYESVDPMHCGGHTSQLCVEQALDKSNCKPIVDKARDIVKALHCQSLVLQLEEKKLCIPPIDNTTRWFSTYSMVRFHAFKASLQSIVNCVLSLSFETARWLE